MEKSKLLELLSANDVLSAEIGKIINYGDLGGEPISNLLSREWTMNGTMVLFDRSDDENNMYEYCAWQISSLGARGEELFCGKSDGIFYAMAYPEDENWDDTQILILDLDKFQEFDDDKLY